MAQQDPINEDGVPTQTYWKVAPDHSPHAETLSANGTQSDVAPQPLPTVPGYTIERELRSGGMGAVYLARTSDGTCLALKMIRADRVGQLFQERFRREKDALCELYHPNVVRIYYPGQTEDGSPYFTMPYFERGALADHLGDFQADPRKAVALMIKVAEAVHYLHENGRIHRDLKPQNILLGDNGEPYVSDFGLVKDLDLLQPDEVPADYRFIPSTDAGFSKAETRPHVAVGERPTGTAGVVGTMPYMSPEQLLQRKDQIGPGTDIWALGVILYELLCGVRPFEAETPEVVSQLIRNESPHRPGTVKPGLDAGLEQIVLKCLAKAPEARYGASNSLANDLALWLRSTRTKKKPRRVLAVLSMFLAALLLTGAVLAVVKWKHRQAEPISLENARDDIRRKLQNGEKVAFVGIKGEPLLPLRIEASDGARADYVSKEGLWAIDTFGTVFVEIVDDPGVDTFTFSVQLRQERRNDMGGLGIYFADQPLKHAAGDGHLYGLIAFAENARPAVDDPRKTCRCEPNLRYYGRRVDKPAFHKSLSLDTKTSFFVGKPEGGSDSWRTVSVVGSPGGYELFFDGEPIFRVPREAPVSWQGLVQNDWKLPGNLDFSPRRPLGIFISHASVSIRLAELSPGRNP